MTAKIRLFLLCCLFFPILLLAQRPIPGKITDYGTRPSSVVDTFGRDSLKVSIDKTLNVSKDALDEPVDYEAKDSIIFDNANNLVHLYGNASIKYQTIEVKAAYIVLNVKDNIATAESRKDSTGRLRGIPDFKDKEQTFKAQRMRYNFKNKKGIIYDVQTKQENLYVLGEKTKYVSAKDTTQNDVIYSKNAILTTCSDPHPHFGIRANKMKVIANKMVIVGASNLEIGGVPTPVWLPFGFYPVTKQKQTGLIFPTFARTGIDGLGVQGLGWYFPINQYVDLTVKGDYYANGRFGIDLGANYKKRYQFNGSFSAGFKNLVTSNAPGLKKTYQRPLTLDWRHTQDQAANPNQTFSASVGISTNAAALQRNVQNAVRDVSSNVNRSTVNYSRRFPDKPYSFNSGISINQTVATHAMDISPDLNFSINTLYPLKKFKREGKDDLLNTVFEQFNISPTARASAAINTYDTLLFDKTTLENKLRAGMQYGVSASMPLRAFKFLTISPNASFNQNVNFDITKKEFIKREKIDSVLTTDPFGKAIKTAIFVPNDSIYNKKVWQATPISTFNMGVSANTTVFGTLQFKKGYFRGIRHKMDLGVGFNYSPVLTKASWYDTVEKPRQKVTDVITKQQYSIFEGGLYNSAAGSFDPNNKAKGTKTLSISTTHNIEIKLKGKKDSVAQKKIILRSFGIGLNINLNVDTFKYAPSFSPRFDQTLFGGLVSVNFTPRFSSQVQVLRPGSTTWYDSKEYIWNKEKLFWKIPKPTAFQGGNFIFSSRISVADVKKMIEKYNRPIIQDTSALKLKSNKENIVEGKKGLTQPVKEESANTLNFKNISSLIDNFNLSHSLSFDMSKDTSRNNKLTMGSHTLTLNGSIPLSGSWSINFGSLGYNFKDKKIPYASIGISRNLHCWEISGNWYPTRGAYLFTIKVIDSPFGDFLKYPVQKQNGDAFGGYR